MSATTFRNWVLAFLGQKDSELGTLAMRLTVDASLAGLDGNLLREQLIRENANAKQTIWDYYNCFELWKRVVERSPVASIDPEAYRELFHTYDQIVNAPPLEFVIENFLQKDGIALIGGPSGHMKSFILQSIAKALLTGCPLWNYFPVTRKATRVLYLIPESALGPFAHRLNLFGLTQFCAPNDGRLLVRTLSLGMAPKLDDPRLLYAAKCSDVVLDTAVRFAGDMEDENSARQSNQFANLLFALLASGARTVIGAHHSPKTFAKENFMTLENVLRGSGDIGAMLSTAWGVKLIDPENSIVHVQNIKPRDFTPPKPFQLIGRPYIDQQGDLVMLKKPGECGSLEEEQPERNKGGASDAERNKKAANLALMKEWQQDGDLPAPELRMKFKAAGISLTDATIRGYKAQLRKNGGKS